MPKILHLLTRSDDSLALAIAAAQQGDPANQVEVIDLTVGEPAYAQLVEKVFAADSIETW